MKTLTQSETVHMYILQDMDVHQSQNGRLKVYIQYMNIACNQCSKLDTMFHLVQTSFCKKNMDVVFFLVLNGKGQVYVKFV